MPVNPAPNGPSTSVLAYNGDSPRGWNDPPTFAFSKSTGSKPKLDLRKRVSHQQALHGTNTPPYSSNPPTTYGAPGAEVTDRMASLSLHSSPVTTGNIGPPPPSITPPQQPKIMHHHSPPSMPIYTPPTTTHYDYHRSNSMPSMYMPNVSPAPASHVEPVSTPDIHNASSNPSSEPTTQASGYLGQPLFSLKDHSFEPVKTHNSGVRSTAEIGDHLDDHNHSPPSHPQIFHPTPQPVANGVHSTAPPVGHIAPPVGTTHSGRISPLPKGTRSISPHPAIPVAPSSHPAMAVTTALSHPAMPVTSALAYPAMPVTATLAHPTSVTSASILHPVGVSSSQAPPPVGHFPLPTHQVQPHMGGTTTTPPPSIPTLPVGTRTPTPPSGLALPPGSLSTGSTPRCLSPEQDDSGMSDEEGLKATVDALNDVIQKFKLEKRICDDIARRLQVMSKMWMTDKLSKTVKTRMIKLAKALDDGNGEEAHHIHVSIIVDHVAEVNQWMVAVKRLISLVRHQPAATS